MKRQFEQKFLPSETKTKIKLLHMHLIINWYYYWANMRLQTGYDFFRSLEPNM